MKKGWQKKKLRDVCELINGRAYSKPELLAEGKYRVLRVGNFFTNDHWYHSDMELEERKYCDTGDLLYAWSASFGPRIWTGGKVIYHYHIWKVAHDRAHLDQKFLFYYFEWDTEKIKEDQGTGTTMMHVSMGSMNDRDIQFPSLSEQQRIVGMLDEAFAGLATAQANAEKNLQNARALFESHLESVFRRRGERWVEAEIGEVGEVFDGPHATPKTVDSGPIFLGISALQRGNINLDETRHVTPADFQRWTRRVKPQPDDVVFSYETRLGQAAIIPEGLECCLGRRMGLVRLDRKRVDPRFFVYQYLSPPFRAFLDSKTVRGATVDRIALKEFPSFPIALPPLDQQRRIADNLATFHTEADHLQSIYQQKLAALAALKKSLLHRAFTGQL